MTEIRRLGADELPAFVPIVANAYPTFSLTTVEQRQQTIERWVAQLADPTLAFYGAFREERLVGGMKLYDYTMNVFGAQVPTGGVGLVAVDFFSKKQRVAYDLIQFFVRHYRERGAALVELYPFRPDFYRQMGFGYGTKSAEYRLAPASLPQGANHAHVRPLTPADTPLLADCYDRYQRHTHGMIARPREFWDRALANPEAHFAGVERDGRLDAYLSFTFKPETTINWLTQDLSVDELVYETPDALAELLAFLRSQADEIRRVIVHTQEEDFHLVAADPRDGTNTIFPHIAHETNTQGVGILYRVVDLPGLFAALREHDFGGQTCRLQLTVRDSFLPENDCTVVIHFNNGRPLVIGESDADVQVALDVADCSSLVMGSVAFASLYRYGRATISDTTYLPTLDRLFRAEQRPICMTAF